jgi:hypothetical protein
MYPRGCLCGDLAENRRSGNLQLRGREGGTRGLEIGGGRKEGVCLAWFSWGCAQMATCFALVVSRRSALVQISGLNLLGSSEEALAPGCIKIQITRCSTQHATQHSELPDLPLPQIPDPDPDRAGYAP